MAACCHSRPCRQAVSITQSEMRSEIDDALTSGMKSAGATTPRIGMPPADQRLRAGQPAVLEADLRLIEQLQFLTLGGQHELGFEQEPRLELVADAALEEHVAAAAGDLGAVKREVGVAEQLVRRLAIVRIDRDADADVDANLALADGEGDLAEASEICSASSSARSTTSAPLTTMANSSPLRRATRLVVLDQRAEPRRPRRRAADRRRHGPACR